MSSFEIKLAWKYFRTRRRSLARLTGNVAIIGIAAGVASLIVAQALARGFADEMRDKILANSPHISIFLKDREEMPNWKEIAAELTDAENVSVVTPTSYMNAVINGNVSDEYAVIRVVSESFGRSGTGFVERNSGDEHNSGNSEAGPVAASDFAPVEISVGAELAEKAGLSKGAAAGLITFANGEAPKKTIVKIKAIFQTGLYEYDSTWINLSPEAFAQLSSKETFMPTILSVSVKDIYKSDESARGIRDKLGERFRVLDWQEANRPLFAALVLERRAVMAMIALIVLIAALNITATLALLVNERRLDIAVLRTCGASARSLVTVFLLEGMILGSTGIVLGVVGGLAACFAGNYFRIISLPTEVYSLSHVPLNPGPANIFLIVSAVFALSFAATVYPAFKASRTKPLENLRRH